MVNSLLISLRCDPKLDSADVYLKQPPILHGTAEGIFQMVDSLNEQMIEYIVLKDPVAVPQQGEPVMFSHRTPAQSDLTLLLRRRSERLVRFYPYAGC